jgi:hypothetical protein
MVTTMRAFLAHGQCVLCHQLVEGYKRIRWN